ncbi:cbb3-type cytochrome oxidase assembly protein CcoS [Aquamicrobium segne]|uniref:Cbb3-type cytochrome oxidase assembly protein CcoS n=1 Tax=Aquamicrobium segne TaxID=469547 RepID=A0ABW0GYB1_9HYPH
MSVLIYLIPAALIFGTASLITFLWTLRSGQYDDLDGAAYRVLMDDDADKPGDDTKP